MTDKSTSNREKKKSKAQNNTEKNEKKTQIPIDDESELSRYAEDLDNVLKRYGITTFLTEKTSHEIDKRAKKLNISRAELIRRIIERWIDIRGYEKRGDILVPLPILNSIMESIIPEKKDKIAEEIARYAAYRLAYIGTETDYDEMIMRISKWFRIQGMDFSINHVEKKDKISCTHHFCDTFSYIIAKAISLGIESTGRVTEIVSGHGYFSIKVKLKNDYTNTSAIA